MLDTRQCSDLLQEYANKLAVMLLEARGNDHSAVQATIFTNLQHTLLTCLPCFTSDTQQHTQRLPAGLCEQAGCDAAGSQGQ